MQSNKLIYCHPNQHHHHEIYKSNFKNLIAYFRELFSQNLTEKIKKEIK